MNSLPPALGIVWAQYGPYHFARAEALVRLAAPARVHPIEIASRTRDYEWSRLTRRLDLVTLFPGAVAEELPFLKVFRQARRRFRELNLTACLLPSYAPRQSLAALLAAKSLGLRTIMMNETHAGTAKSGGLGTALKRRLVGLFDAALVGGRPHKCYFASLGLPPKRIFTGYDAVDNDYFALRADEARGRDSDLRASHDLPEHYFLSLGRFVAKKNLTTLIQAYGRFLAANASSPTHLVMVGSGEQEPRLRALCGGLDLPVYDKSESGKSPKTVERRRKGGKESPGVHFYGFRQISENPIFYALADAFILPSLYEEWGLVVNEAMACGLPVVVSETAGCAEDLLEGFSPLERNTPELSADASAAGLRRKLRRNGFVFNPRSSEELGRVLGCLSQRAEMRAAMAEAGRGIVEKFSCANFARNALLSAAPEFQRLIPNQGTVASRELINPGN